MNMLLNIWKKIPRQARVVILVAVIVLCIIVIYAFFGSPILSLEDEFRRAEKASMVGPSEILDSVNLEKTFDSYQKMLIADDGDGIILYCYEHTEQDPSKLIYRKKTGDLTIVGAPYPIEARSKLRKSQVPIYVFDEFPDAVRAELELTLYASYFGEEFEKTYFMESTRGNPGYFQFILGATNRYGLGVEGYAIQVLTLISGYEGHNFPDVAFPATVRLYNEADELICERELVLTSISEQAHNARGE